MRFLHTADWHIGRQFHNQSLLEDQAWWLERFVELVASERPDAVVIAGDVYDRAVPSADAVRLLDDTLERIVGGLGVPVLLVAGNHDSPERIGFGADLLDGAGLHVAGPLEESVRSIVVSGESGDVRFWLMPYADPIRTRAVLGDESIHDHEAAVAAVIGRIREAEAPEGRRVLVTHHFVSGATTSESERGLTVGGTGEVDAALFEGFDYVALGHLHRPQSVGGTAHVRYAGSALKYSFAESAHAKSVTLVTLEPGSVATREIELGARRDVRQLIGAFADVLDAAALDEARDDYIEVVLDEPVMPPDALGRLREFYPNLLKLGRRLDFELPDGPDAEAGTVQVETLSEEELFEQFFEYATGEKLADDERSALHELLVERGGEGA